MAPTYQAAISDARVLEGSDRRVELSNCVRQWVMFRANRDARFGEFEDEKNERFTIFLEIGNSAFPRYDFVMMTGKSMKSSLDGRTAPLPSPFIQDLRNLVERHINDIQGVADSKVDDGDCYFLTVRMGSEARQVAIYGNNASTAAGMLITKLLSQARAESSTK